MVSSLLQTRMRICLYQLFLKYLINPSGQDSTHSGSTDQHPMRNYWYSIYGHCPGVTTSKRSDCLKTTLAVPQAVSIASIASVISSNDLKGFSRWKSCVQSSELALVELDLPTSLSIRSDEVPL